ncbi:MAG: hypothetical protein JWQ42_929, partial [Edaphobacter sp.]|nr:hypothetical protein [Edaphobacter sp.]
SNSHSSSEASPCRSGNLGKKQHGLAISDVLLQQIEMEDRDMTIGKPL